MDNVPGPSPDPTIFSSSPRTTVPGPTLSSTPPPPPQTSPPEPPLPRPPASHLGKIFFLAGVLVVLLLAAMVAWLVWRNSQVGVEPGAKPPPAITPALPRERVATDSSEASPAVVPKVFRHKVCLGSACSAVDCSPPSVPCANSCSANSDCSSSASLSSGSGPATPTATLKFHQECRNNTCVKVSGPGQNTCTSDVSCQPAAVLPPVPESGNPALTIAGLVLGVGALVLGLLLVF